MAKKKVNKVDKVKAELLKDKRIKESGVFLIYNELNIINLDTRSIAFKGWFKNDLEIYHKMCTLFGKTLQKRQEDDYIRFVTELINYIESLPRFEFELTEKEPK